MKTHQNKSTKTYKNVKHDQTPSNTNQSPSKTIKNNQQLIKKTITHHQEPTENTLNTKKSNKPQQTMLRKKNISPGDLKKHQNVLLASLCFAQKGASNSISVPLFFRVAKTGWPLVAASPRRRSVVNREFRQSFTKEILSNHPKRIEKG